MMKKAIDDANDVMSGMRKGLKIDQVSSEKMTLPFETHNVSNVHVIGIDASTSDNKILGHKVR